MTRDEWAALARSFPTLDEAPGVQPGERVDPLALDAWGTHPHRGDGARCAVRFMLHIFDSHRAWEVGPFSMREAWGRWDDRHQAVWRAWAMEPRFA